eukprot:TRINITY_DN4186_c0_g2_i1.p1 TRINITY_DN4186_c0_g2~~TRINITY_DN4186_c0_g2_i1.p1  ORF type:complete len:395 (+),score=56.92 TRINITY_DN4186_c0_g2_i1:133-1185(+)
MSTEFNMRTEALGFPFPTPDPFLFCVYHKDDYPAGDEYMQAPRRGNGADFNSKAPYRMYHGDTVPGFPQHPHRGFETLTATMMGIVDHSDSTGACGRYGHGDLQWMTAGRGVVHGEMFPLVNADSPNPLELFQIWLNLPAKSKMVDPHFVMHWSENIPRITSPDQKATVTLWAGDLHGTTGSAPPPHSWAADPDHEVMVCLIRLQPGGTFSIPAARKGAAINRSFYFFKGPSLTLTPSDGVGRKCARHMAIHTDGAVEVELENDGEGEGEVGLTQVLMLQGQPIGEPVAQHGPFVMNTQRQIQQAFLDYQRTQFGGWPWDQDAVVFPRDKGRFARKSGDADEEFPPQTQQ